MSTRPFMSLYVSDLLGDTTMLSDAEFGSYVALLCAMWNHKGWLPDNPEKLARAAKYRGRAWPKRWEALAGFFTVEDGRITNPRMLDDIEHVQRVSHLRATSGAQGGRAKSLKTKNRRLANASTPDTKVIDAPSGQSITTGKAVRSPVRRTALPVKLERALQRALGPQSFDSYLSRATYDPDAQTLTPATRTAWDKLRRECAAELREAGVTLIEPARLTAV